MLQIGFLPKKAIHKMKCQIGTFHELLPGNLVFFHFYYIGTKEIEYLNHTIELSIKSYISMEILSIGIKILCKTSRDQTVAGQRPEFSLVWKYKYQMTLAFTKTNHSHVSILPFPDFPPYFEH